MNTEKQLKENFYGYLKEKGYKEFTPSGKPSTIYDYLKRIEKICKIEKTSWVDLAEQIQKVVKDYDIGGIKETIGKCNAPH